MAKLIILHGWGQSAAAWQQFVDSVDFAEAEAWDLPGFGNEPLLSAEWGVPEYAAWVGQKIIERDLHDVVLVGHSFGGRICSFLAAQDPAWLKGLVLDGSPSIYRPDMEIKLKILLAKVMKKLGIKRKLVANSELQSAADSGNGQIFRKVVMFDQTQLLPQIKVPTLLIWGAQDETVPVRIAEEIHQLIPQSQLVIFPEAGHFTYQANPHLYYGTIKQFVQNL